MNRRRLTSLQRTRIFDAASGRCWLCGEKIMIGEAWDVEHRKPLWLGGEDEPTNLSPAHTKCHKSKTADEAPVRAKSDRIRARHVGARKQRRPMIGSRASGWKRKMSGEWERR